MAKKKCIYCGHVQEVRKSKSPKWVLDGMWGGDAFAFRCNKCGSINYK